MEQTEQKHTPTPWKFVKEDPLFGKDRNWGFIQSESVRAVVVGVGTFSRNSFGEREEYSGVRILPADAAYIVKCVNSHAQLVAAQAALMDVLDSMGALSNFSELCGYGFDTERAKEIISLSAATKEDNK